MTKIARDLATMMLVVDPEGRSSLEDIKNHLFFKGVDWEAVKTREVKPYFIPELKDDNDIQYFKTKLTEKERLKIEESENPLGVAEYLEMQPRDVTENTFINSGLTMTTKNWIDNF
mmetsp:Transcript_14787/g.14681  ORF Transcript_14787/g.14681 Transcript_14787/m.14681 type:complete len:116 (-) Transcript_14787:20-367(-)